jgi:hypothetical protein
MFWNVKGQLRTKTDCGIVRVPWDITLLAVRLVTQDGGTGGTTTIDFQYYRSGTWTSVCGVKPSVTSTSNYVLSTNGTLSTTAILSGDLIRMNIDSIQTGGDSCRGLLGILEFSKT